MCNRRNDIGLITRTLHHLSSSVLIAADVESISWFLSVATYLCDMCGHVRSRRTTPRTSWWLSNDDDASFVDYLLAYSISHTSSIRWYNLPSPSSSPRCRWHTHVHNYYWFVVTSSLLHHGYPDRNVNQKWYWLTNSRRRRRLRRGGVCSYPSLFFLSFSLSLSLRRSLEM